MSDVYSDALTTAQLEDGDVAHYLDKHPSFFQNHPDLLQKLALNHPTRGGTVSLIERQIELLRERNQRQDSHLDKLMETARRNEQRVLHMNRLAATLIGATTLQDTLQGIHRSMSVEFDVEHVLVLLRMNESVSDHTALRVIEPGGALDGALDDFFRTGKTECGPLQQPLARTLWPAVSPLPASAALVPLDRHRKMGALVLASSDPDRFSAEMGDWFLEQVANLIACACQAQSSAAIGDDA